MLFDPPFFSSFTVLNAELPGPDVPSDEVIKSAIRYLIMSSLILGCTRSDAGAAGDLNDNFTSRICICILAFLCNNFWQAITPLQVSCIGDLLLKRLSYAD